MGFLLAYLCWNNGAEVYSDRNEMGSFKLVPINWLMTFYPQFAFRVSTSKDVEYDTTSLLSYSYLFSWLVRWRSFSML